MIFILNFPIRNQEEYWIYRFIMANANRNSKISIYIRRYIQPYNPFLAISQNKRKHISITELEVTNCDILSSTRFCFLNSVVCLKKYPLCDIQLYDSEYLTALPKRCEVRHSYHDNTDFEKLQRIHFFCIG